MNGKVPQVLQELHFDETPTPGSLNPVTSGGVAEAVGNVAEQTEQDMKDMEEMFLVNLPCAAKTLRFEFSKMDYDPTVAGVGGSGTWKKVNAKFHNVWDWTNTNTDWHESFKGVFPDEDNEVRVIAAGDTSDVVDISYMFSGELTSFAHKSNYSLTQRNNVTSCVPFDVSSCVNFEGAFEGSSLRYVVPFKYNPSLTYSGEDIFSVIFADTYIEKVVDLDFYGVNSKSSGLFARCTKLKKASLKGLYNFVYFNNVFWGPNTGYCIIEDFELTGDLNSSNIALFFQNCRKLKRVSGLNNIHNNVVSQGVFLQCFELEELEFNVGRCSSADYLFSNCRKLKNLPLMDTSNNSNFLLMMDNCREIETIPDYDVSNATNVKQMCRNMYKAKYGILEMYNKLLARGAAITNHTDCFLNCGRDTEEGRAALSQIPASWGGLAEE